MQETDAGANRGDVPLNTPNNTPDNLGLDINQYSGETTADADQNGAQVDSQTAIDRGPSGNNEED